MGAQCSCLVGRLVTVSYGSIFVNADGTYHYTFNNNDPVIQALRASSDTLIDSFSYTITDGSGLASIAQINIAITGSNDNPIATADTIIAREEGGFNNSVAGINPTGNVLANDVDVDAGDTKTIVGVAGGVLGSVLGGVGISQVGVYGALVLAADGSYTYTIDNTNSFVEALRLSTDTLTDIFTYRMRDTAGAASTTQITIVIQGANDAPIAQTDSAIATAAGGSSFPTGINPTGNVLSNDADIDTGDTHTVVGVSAGVVTTASGSVATNISGSFGSLRINADGSFVYTVDNSNEQVRLLSWSSPWLKDVFSYTMTDAGGLQSTAQITVSIRGVNDAPITVSDTASAIEAGGVNNGTVGTNPTGNLLANDSDPDAGDTMTVTGFTSGTVSMVNGGVNSNIAGNYGTIVVQSNGSFTYTVNNSNTAVQALRTSSDRLDDVFSYTNSDSLGRKSTAQLTVTIQGVNDALVTVSDSATALEAGGLGNATLGTNPSGNVLTNDTDVDAGDTKTVTGVSAGVVSSASTDVGSSVNGFYGSISIAADGSYTYTVDNTNSTVQALRTTLNTLTDIFTYTARDTAGAFSTTQITITIQGANDTPIASIDTASAVEAGGVANGTAGVNPTGNVLTNDFDVDSGDTKAVTGVASGLIATATLNAGTSVTGTYGSVVINSDGSYTYTVNNSNAAVQALRTSGETLSDVFTYTMRDTVGATSNAQLSITITGSNDAPVAVVDVITAVEAGGLNNATAGTDPTGNVMTNDTDVDAGDTKTVIGVEAGVVASASTNVGSAIT
ncbi:MAG: VCBS domain-containing protein, partial [Pirellulaceae bacterium]